MTNIYIDPAFAKPMAWAMFDEDFISCGNIEGLDDLAKKIKESDGVYCEDQVPGKSFESIKKLIRSAGWVECLCRMEGKLLTFVHPMRWKAHYGLNRRGWTEEMRWAYKIRLAQDYFPNHILYKARHEDQVDAILMGAYVEWLLSIEKQEHEHSHALAIVANNVASTPRRRGSTATTKPRTPRGTGKSTGML